MPRTRSSPAKAKPPSNSAAAAAAKASPNKARKPPPEADPPSLAPPKYGEVMPDRDQWWGPEEAKLRIENPPEGKELMARVVTVDGKNPLRELVLFAPGIDDYSRPAPVFISICLNFLFLPSEKSLFYAMVQSASFGESATRDR